MGVCDSYSSPWQISWMVCWILLKARFVVEIGVGRCQIKKTDFEGNIRKQIFIYKE